MNKVLLELSIAELVLIRQMLIQGLGSLPADTFTANAIEDLLKNIINKINVVEIVPMKGGEK